jgi:hypothetical protein
MIEPMEVANPREFLPAVAHGIGLGRPEAPIALHGPRARRV